MKILPIILTVALMGVATATFAQDKEEGQKPQRPQVSEKQRGPQGPMMHRGEFGGPRGPMLRGQGPMGPGPRGPMFRGGRGGPELDRGCCCPCHEKHAKAQKHGKGKRQGRK